MKKFFNFELLFPIDDTYLNSILREQVSSTLNSFYVQVIHIPSVEDQFFSNEVVKNVFRSPRDVYRYINLLSYSLDLCKRYGVLDELNVIDLLKLLLIQFISPMVYKILRDEKSLLLDTRSSDGRIYLKDEYKDIIISRQSKTQVQKVVAAMNLQQEENNHKEKLTLFDLPTIERPNNEDMVSDLLQDLFYDRANYQKKDRICYEAEYFKYFAGKYSKYELSYKYIKDLMELSDAKFDEVVIHTVEQGKSDFLLHKLKQYVEENRLNLDIPMALQRCLRIQDSVYRFWVQNQSQYVSPMDFSEAYFFSSVYSNLLLVDSGEVVTDKDAIDNFKSIYANNQLFSWLAYSLTLQPMNQWSYVYGNDLLMEMKKTLIHRFINEELSDNPFKREKLEAIPMLRNMYQSYWDQVFSNYIDSYHEPKAWLYMLLKPVKDTLRWNVVTCHNLVNDISLDKYATDYLKLTLSYNEIHDLQAISLPNLSYLDETTLSHNPFLIEAKKWWSENGQSHNQGQIML